MSPSGTPDEQPLSLRKQRSSAPQERQTARQEPIPGPGNQPVPQQEQPSLAQGEPFAPQGQQLFPPQQQQLFSAQGQHPFQPQGQPAFPPQGQPYPPASQPWPPQPPPRRGRGGVIALVLVLVLMVLGGGSAGAYFFFVKDGSDESPKVDTSRDLTDAPMGCGLFTEVELARFVPGTFTTEPSEILGGDRDYEKSAQCAYSNQKTRSSRQPGAWVIVTTRLHKVNNGKSGVDRATADLGRQVGSAVGLPGADDDKFREIKSSRDNVNQAELTFRYANLVITITYHHDGLGEKKFTQPLMDLGSLALSKVTG